MSHDGETRKGMWFANDSMAMYPLCTMLHFVRKENETAKLLFVHP